jgi:hypothetical protein
MRRRIYAHASDTVWSGMQFSHFAQAKWSAAQDRHGNSINYYNILKHKENIAGPLPAPWRNMRAKDWFLTL